MSLVPVYYPPGICKNTTRYSAGRITSYENRRITNGRYTGGDKMRFVSGFPEKIGGWASVATTNDTNLATLEFRTNNNTPLLAIGALGGLYIWNNVTVTDITPLLPLQSVTVDSVGVHTALGSNAVTIDYVNANIQQGDSIYIAGASVGGLSFGTWFFVQSVTATNFVAVSQSKATSAVSVTQQMTFGLVRAQSTNVSTTAGSTLVTLSINTAGIEVGNMLTVTTPVSVGGISLSGKYPIASVGATQVTFNAHTAAKATVKVTTPVSITVGITAKQQGATTGLYGRDVYGVGAYGTATNAHGYPGIGWILQSYGQQLLSAPIGGTIYVYDPSIGGRAVPLLNAPKSVQAFVVTPERFVIALGINNSFLQLAWPDQNDYTDWTTTTTNTANSGRTLQGGSTFIAGAATRNGTTLLFTDKAVFQASYVAGTYIYNTPMLSDNTGIIGPHASVAIGDVVFWMGSNEFWQYNGTVTSLPSDDIREYVFSDINQDKSWKAHAGTYLNNKEVWFFYPSANSDVCDKYVIFHTDSDCWSIGTLQRSSWIHDDLFVKPFATTEDGKIFVQETGKDDDGKPLPWLLETSDTDIDSGSMNCDVFGFIPDFERLVGNAYITINTILYPLSPIDSDGPFSIDDSLPNERVDLRSSGKAFSFSLSGEGLGCDYRIGVCRIDYQPSGARR